MCAPWAVAASTRCEAYSSFPVANSIMASVWTACGVAGGTAAAKWASRTCRALICVCWYTSFRSAGRSAMSYAIHALPAGVGRITRPAYARSTVRKSSNVGAVPKR